MYECRIEELQPALWWGQPYQLLEYQTDMRRCKFDTLGKQTSAHLAGGPTPYTGWVPPASIHRAGGMAARPRGGGPGDAASALTPRAGGTPPRIRGGPACKGCRGLFP